MKSEIFSKILSEVTPEIKYKVEVKANEILKANQMKKQILALTDYHTDETIDFACKRYLESRGYFVAEKDTDGLVNLDRLPMTYLKVWNKGKKELHYVIGISGEKFVSISEQQLWKNAKVPSKKKIVEKFSELGIDIEK